MVLHRPEDRDARALLAGLLFLRAQQHGAGGGDRRGGADRDMANAIEQFGDGADQYLARMNLAHHAGSICVCVFVM